MLDTLAARLAAVPTPAPSPTSKVPDTAVTPGVWGFVVTAAIGVVVILLILDMIRRLRRVNYRAEVRERIAAEQAAGETGESRSDG
ncbi:hypothetical protein [Pseudolysinimonas sp.]|uniref:hypothetical protein n=1 Tax=Pseudolysinimonas sp. TaxID=2680009 RepID=UPI003F7D111C